MFMGSMLGDLPSYDPHNFSQLRPSDRAHPSKSSPTTYCPTHSRTSPPPNQVISTEATNILLRQFYQQTEEKLMLKPKRAASDHLTPDQGGRKQLRSCFTNDTI